MGASARKPTAAGPQLWQRPTHPGPRLIWPWRAARPLRSRDARAIAAVCFRRSSSKKAESSKKADLRSAMSIKSDNWIRRMAREHGMIEPFAAEQVRHVAGRKIVSFGTSSYGYDV